MWIALLLHALSPALADCPPDTHVLMRRPLGEICVGTNCYTPSHSGLPTCLYLLGEDDAGRAHVTLPGHVRLGDGAVPVELSATVQRDALRLWTTAPVRIDGEAGRFVDAAAGLPVNRLNTGQVRWVKHVPTERAADWAQAPLSPPEPEEEWLVEHQTIPSPAHATWRVTLPPVDTALAHGGQSELDDTPIDAQVLVRVGTRIGPATLAASDRADVWSRESGTLNADGAVTVHLAPGLVIHGPFDGEVVATTPVRTVDTGPPPSYHALPGAVRPQCHATGVTYRLVEATVVASATTGAPIGNLLEPAWVHTTEGVPSVSVVVNTPVAQIPATLPVMTAASWAVEPTAWNELSSIWAVQGGRCTEMSATLSEGILSIPGYDTVRVADSPSPLPCGFTAPRREPIAEWFVTRQACRQHQRQR